MIKFDEQKQLDSVAGALAIRKEIEGIAADVAGRGYKNICYLGIGGTYASALQTQNHVQEYSGMEIIAQNAALYNTTGQPPHRQRHGDRTVLRHRHHAGGGGGGGEGQGAGRGGHRLCGHRRYPAGEAQRLRHPLSPERAAEVLHAGGPPDAAGRRLPPVRAAVRRV